jgi:peptidoglycan/LPS O-acetylase OafA/YrhL
LSATVLTNVEPSPLRTASSSELVPQQPQLKHVPALDGVRGLAIGLVLLVHFIGNTRPDTSLESVIVKLANLGTYGVALFFVLSGFLITGILIDAKGQPHYFRNFYARRTLRIFPLYYGVLVLLAVWPASLSPVGLELTRERQGWLWGYVANFLIAKEGSWEALPYFNHFWSLAIEEHFYFLWPLLVARSSRRGLLTWAVALSVFALLLRGALAAAGANPLVAYTITPARLDGLCFGGLLAIWLRSPGGLAQMRRLAPKVSAAVLVYLVVGHLLTHSVWPEGHAVYFEGRESGIVVLFGVLLVSVLAARRGSLLTRFFTSAPMVTMGKYSYGLYVFHVPLSWYLSQARTEDDLAALVGSHTLAVFVQASAGIAFTMGVAYASFHLFEKRFLSLKARFEANPRAAGR